MLRSSSDIRELIVPTKHVTGVSRELFDIFGCVQINTVAAITGYEAVYRRRMTFLPLPATDVNRVLQNYLTHFVAKDHRVTALALHLRNYD
jgi:hypothetical protein